MLANNETMCNNKTMKNLKPETIVKRLAKIEQAREDEKKRYSEAMYKLADEVESVQSRCEHAHIDRKWHDTWDGWDEHEDLKGHYSYSCKTCGKVLKDNVVPSEDRKYWPNFRKACGLE